MTEYVNWKKAWNKEQNPVVWYKKERNAINPDYPVERWWFEHVYDYAQWLHEKVFCEPDTKSDNLYRPGNVLKCLGEWPFYVMVCLEPHQCPDWFEAVTLLDARMFSFPGDKSSQAKFLYDNPRWRKSSMKEVTRAMG